MMMLTTAFLHDKSYDHDDDDDDKVIDNNVDKNHELHSREVVRPSLKSNPFKLHPGDYRETRGTNINTNIFLFYLKVHN